MFTSFSIGFVMRYFGVLTRERQVGFGPAFLWKTEDQWPINHDHSEGTFDLQNNDPEVKKHVTMATRQTIKVDSEKTSLCERVKYFSDWYHAK